MEKTEIRDFLKAHAYVRESGSREELCCAEALREACERMGLQTETVPFSVRGYRQRAASLTVDGREVPCTGWNGSENATVTAEVWYLSDSSPAALKGCRGRIVLSDRGMGYKLYDQIVAHGAVGFITCGGLWITPEETLAPRAIRYTVGEDARIPGVHIHITEAARLVREGGKRATLTLCTEEQTYLSHNVIATLPGESEETVLLSAHYDSTPLSQGVYDNLSGSVALLSIADSLIGRPHRRTVRFLWCGSEETGLQGSLAYCRDRSDELRNTVLNINLDMLGCVLGGFVGYSCANDSMTSAMEHFFESIEFPATVRYGIRSSDSNSFVRAGIAAASFARSAPAGMPSIHTVYDRLDLVDEARLKQDADAIAAFTEHLCDAEELPFSLNLSEKIQKDIEEYFQRMKTETPI